MNTLEPTKKDALEKLSFFPHLTKEEQALLLANTRPIFYQKGQTVYSAGQECHGVVLVLSGCLRAYIMSDDGREVTLYHLQNDDVCILSASCLLSKISFDAYIVAEADTAALRIDVATFERLQRSNVYCENFALSVAVERFSDVMWSLEQMLFNPIPARIAGFLLDESGRTGSDTLVCTHQQIANSIASAREVVSRTLKKLEQSGFVALGKGTLTLLDKAALAHLLVR